ncbi:unnamed protein product [Moneuplotes crassus]|uniref:Uncharacterized protein n=1 Tax=Euplotes crassus TaxID=5936 RepID=A0AAD1ULZ1_EUPCR|nr:unnamed protein product [Moneuplotes crassus]
MRAYQNRHGKCSLNYLTQKVIVDLDSPRQEAEEESSSEPKESDLEQKVDEEEILLGRKKSGHVESRGTVGRKKRVSREETGVGKSCVEMSKRFKEISRGVDCVMRRRRKRHRDLQVRYQEKAKEFENAVHFSSMLTKTIQNEVVSSIDKNEIDEIKPTFIDKGERIKFRQRSGSSSILSRTCKSSQREEQPILWGKFIQNNKWYKDEYNHYSQKYSQDGFNIKKVKVFLNEDKQPDNYFSLNSSPKRVTLQSRGNRFEKKDKTNLKYFTSRLTEVPGPVNRNMRRVFDKRSNEAINKTYDEKLYGNVYQIDGSTKKITSPERFPSWRREIQPNISCTSEKKYSNQGRVRDFHSSERITHRQ